MSGLGLTFPRRGGQAHPTAGSNYIKFKDEAVFNILMSNGVSSDGVGITKDDAARVTSIGAWFRNNTTITSFDEFQYFTGVKTLANPNAASNGASPFYNCTNLQTIILPEGLEVIGHYSFAGCVGLVNIQFSSTITSIYSNAFLDVPAKMILYLPNLGGTIANNAFKYSGVQRIESLGNCTALSGAWNSGAFYGCASLEFARLPKTLVDIGQYNFQNCNALSVVICESENPPTLAANNSSLGKADIYVPDASVDAYKAAANWSTHAARIKGISEYNG